MIRRQSKMIELVEMKAKEEEEERYLKKLIDEQIRV